MSKTTHEIVLALSQKHLGNWDNIYCAIQNKEDAPENSSYYECDSEYLTILDNDYPNSLKNNCRKPPFVLYYEGNKDLLKSDKVKVALFHSEKTIKKMGQDYDDILANNDFIYVLGGESVLDEHIINTHKNNLIVVLGYSLDHYPYNLKQKIKDNGGLIITEYPSNSFGNLDNSFFANRYRIIASISDKTLILYATAQSYAPLLVSNALCSGKDILVVPMSHKDKESINNRFIGEGAIPVWDNDSFLNECK